MRKTRFFAILVWVLAVLLLILAVGACYWAMDAHPRPDLQTQAREVACRYVRAYLFDQPAAREIAQHPERYCVTLEYQHAKYATFRFQALSPSPGANLGPFTYGFCVDVRFDTMQVHGDIQPLR